MPDEKAGGGETKRYTFRLSDAEIAELDFLVAEISRENGETNRTTVLRRLIRQEHARRSQPRRKK
jgi:hypothetical protein